MMSDHDKDYEHDDNAGELVVDALPVYDDDIPDTAASGKKEKRRWFSGRKKTVATAKTVTTTAAGTQTTQPPIPRGPGKGRIIHAGLTTLLILATAGQFVLSSSQMTRLEEDQMALARRVPAGVAQRLDMLETTLNEVAAQKTILNGLRTQVDTLTAQAQAPQTLRQEFRDALAQLSDTVTELSQQQTAFSSRLADEQLHLKTALDTLKAAQVSAAQSNATQKLSATKGTPVKAVPAKAASPASLKKPAGATKKAGTQMSVRASGKPPFELRGIEFRGGVPYAVTTTPGDTSFSSLQLLMAGQSRSGWRLVRTTDNSAIFRAPAGTEMALAIR
ncbi:TPA: hypothetical protein LVM22_001129 [Klebsiella oxytoca]|nr:hypothetical protein [Klebsiella oxytoca]